MPEKILIVEDEFIVANDLRLILERAGYQVCGIAGSVPEAQEIIRQQQPRLVLLDIYLKGPLTGIDLARQLTKANIAFVYLSANSNQQVLEEAKATQPYGFLVKPFREKDVLVTLDVARYRHEHSKEAKLRQEAQLQQDLATIAAEPLSWEDKLLKVAKALQLVIPFDYLSGALQDRGLNTLKECSYLRIGFEQYQTITAGALATISGKPLAEVQRLLYQQEQTPAGWYNGSDYSDYCQNMPTSQFLTATFQFAACLTLPIPLPNSHVFIITLYSRKEITYQGGHLELLQHALAELSSLGNDALAKQTSLAITSESHATAYHETSSGFAGIIGDSPSLLEALDHVAQVAPLDTSVLILGESGTGKEKVAQAIHTLSSRRHKPLVKVNCAALPASLIESELFGHEKGAFTGAVNRRIGKFEQADGGTVFLDEIGEMPLEMQVKLLRVLQEKEIERIGGRSALTIDVRIVAATNRNLEKEVGEGRFRLDLYYRLNVFPVTLPPLRERTGDIQTLAVHFSQQFCQKFKKPFFGISDAMIENMQTYRWPGNIRELENIIEQSVILNDGHSALTLQRPLSNTIFSPTEDVNPVSSLATPVSSLDEVKKVQDKTEKEYLISVLKKAEGRVRGKGGAAELLNLKPTTLESRMARLGILKKDLP